MTGEILVIVVALLPLMVVGLGSLAILVCLFLYGCLQKDEHPISSEERS